MIDAVKGGFTMGFLRRMAFYVGMVFGLATVAVAGTVALTYLLTGKVASIEMEGGKPEVTLMTPDEVAVLIRERAGQEIEGGESDDEQK
jgi:hypothetical protein